MILIKRAIIAVLSHFEDARKLDDARKLFNIL